MNKETIKLVKSIKAYIMCLHTDLENGIKIEPFGFAYRFTIQDCDEVLKELEEELSVKHKNVKIK